jgi:hypothetical protein
MQQKPVRKPELTRGCESCDFRGSDFKTDTVDPKIIRCYCKARHFDVDAEIMSKGDCDFWKIHPDYQRPKEDQNRFGL